MAGAFLLLGTVMCALLLVLRPALDSPAVVWIVAPTSLWFITWWFVLPAWACHRAPP